MPSRHLDSKLAVAVKLRRDELKLSREELAELMGAPLEVIIELEESKDSKYMPSKTLRMLLSVALKVSESEFFKAITDASEISDVSDVSDVLEVLEVLEASKDTEQSSPKRLFLPPMFSRARSDEQKISTLDDDNQMTKHFGIPAIPPEQSKPQYRKTRAPTSNQVGSLQKSPFIPRHAVQKTHQIHLSVWKAEVQSGSIANSSSLTPALELNVVVTSPGNANARKNVSQPSVASVQSHVPSLAPGLPAGLPVGLSQKETGIFQIKMAPEPAAFQKIKEDFGKDVPGLTLNTTRVADSKTME